MDAEETRRAADTAKETNVITAHGHDGILEADVETDWENTQSQKHRYNPDGYSFEEET